jgi:hypothetical protein
LANQPVFAVKKVRNISGFIQAIPGLKHFNRINAKFFEDVAGKLNGCGRSGGDQVPCNQVERLINRLTQFRRIATCYDKRAYSYEATVTIAMIFLWLQ